MSSNQYRQKYSALLRALGDVVYDHDPVNGTVHWEGRFDSVLGYSSETIGSDEESWLGRVHPDDLHCVREELQRASLGGHLLDIRYRFRHHDGHYIWVHDKGVVTVDENQQPVRVQGILRDVSIEQEASEALRRATRLYRSIAEHYPRGGIFLYNRDIQIIFAEGQGLREFGLDSEQLIGHRISDFIDEPAIHDLAPLVRRAFEGESFSLETPFLGNQYLVHIQPFERNGEIQNVMLITYDITPRVRATRQLAASERKYRMLIESSTDAIVMLDPHGTIQYVNQRAGSFFGVEGDDLVGSNIADLFPSSSSDRMRANIRRVVENRTPLTFEAKYPFPRGERWLNTGISPIIDEDDVKSVLVVSRDLTDHKEAEELRRKQREQEQRLETIQNMVVTVAHEFRNPLAILLNSANLLENMDQAPDEERLSQLTAKISNSVHRLNQLVEDLVQMDELQEMEYPHGLKIYSLAKKNRRDDTSTGGETQGS